MVATSGSITGGDRMCGAISGNRTNCSSHATPRTWTPERPSRNTPTRPMRSRCSLNKWRFLRVLEKSTTPSSEENHSSSETNDESKNSRKRRRRSNRKVSVQISFEDGDRLRRVVISVCAFGITTLAKLSSGQTDKSQKLSIGSLNQESSGTNAVSLIESVIGTAVRAAVKP